MEAAAKPEVVGRARSRASKDLAPAEKQGRESNALVGPAPLANASSGKGGKSSDDDGPKSETELLVAQMKKSPTAPTDAEGAPSQAVVHLALVMGQAINGGGAVIAKLGLPAVNPIFFALMREVLATPLLALLARRADGPVRIQRQDFGLLAFASFALCCNQVMYITGLKLANPVVGSAWQPSQPVFVLAMSIALGWESFTAAKLAGVLFCMLGGGIMTVAGAHVARGLGGSHEVIGNVLFFFNCFMTAVFVLTMRVISRRMPAYTALAAVYAMASVFIFLLARFVGGSAEAQRFFCPDCVGFWHVPSRAWFSLGYTVLAMSVFAYFVLTFGTKHARDATHCLAYTAVQPVSAATLEALLVAIGWNSWHQDNPLELPGGLQLLGAGLVIGGVLLVAFDAKDASPGTRASSSGASISGVSLSPSSSSART